MIGIIGYGRFGRLAARHLSGDYPVLVCGRRDLSQENMPEGVRVASFHDVCNQRIVIPCMPISSFKEVLAAAAPLMRPDALVADVCSVKEKPVRWMKAALPETVSILGTHPMFGPDSASAGLEGMKIALCRVRIDDDLYGKVVAFLRAFRADGHRNDPGRARPPDCRQPGPDAFHRPVPGCFWRTGTGNRHGRVQAPAAYPGRGGA